MKENRANQLVDIDGQAPPFSENQKWRHVRRNKSVSPDSEGVDTQPQTCILITITTAVSKMTRRGVNMWSSDPSSCHSGWNGICGNRWNHRLYVVNYWKLNTYLLNLLRVNQNVSFYCFILNMKTKTAECFSPSAVNIDDLIAQLCKTLWRYCLNEIICIHTCAYFMKWNMKMTIVVSEDAEDLPGSRSHEYLMWTDWGSRLNIVYVTLRWHDASVVPRVRISQIFCESFQTLSHFFFIDSILNTLVFYTTFILPRVLSGFNLGVKKMTCWFCMFH